MTGLLLKSYLINTFVLVNQFHLLLFISYSFELFIKLSCTFGQLRLSQYGLTIFLWVRVFSIRLDKISSIASCSKAVQAVIHRVIERFRVHDQYYFSVAVCGAPKRRFRTYEPAVTKNANATDARKARKADLQREATLG